MFKIFKPKKGSVLVFSLIVLSILLSAAVAVATVSVSNRKSTLSTDKSNQSFQVANSGVELVLRQIYKTVPTHASLNDLATALGGGAACAGGSITKTGVAGGDIRVSFFDKDDNLISCADTNWRGKVVGVKSEGTAFGTTRLVETAVAAAGDYGWVQIDPGVYQGIAWLHYVNYAAGNHSAEQMCINAGYLHYTGACQTTTTLETSTYVVSGTLVGGLRSDGSSWISCQYWHEDFYFDNAATSKILCMK
ncbi:MAG: hypothetical protein QG606_187 [Patescibacteria group bacterium]|nr:hypothetical protein [Patescibacteria group bacterium]